jgi:tetratricopeptide (TPR) repeat protein
MTQKRRIIILAIIVVIVIGASVATAIYFSNLQNQSSGPDDSPDKGGSSFPEKSPAEKTADNADKVAYEGNVDGGVKQLDDAIANTSDSKELYIFYSRKATLLFNNHRLPEALEAAKKAYEARNSSDSAALVGQIAQAQEDKALAVEYYKKAIEHLDKTDPFADEDKTYYQGIITELGGTL